MGHGLLDRILRNNPDASGSFDLLHHDCSIVSCNQHSVENVRVLRVHKLETSTRGYLYRHIQYAIAHIMMVRQKAQTHRAKDRQTSFVRPDLGKAVLTTVVDRREIFGLEKRVKVTKLIL